MVISRSTGVVVLVEDLRAVAGDDHPVAFLEIGDLLGQRRERQRVGAEIGLALAVADHQRRAEPRADQHVGMLRGRRSPARRRRAAAAAPPCTASCGRCARLDLLGDQMRDDLGVGLALERAAARDQLLAQRLEVLDDAVVDQRDFAGRVRVRVVRGRRAMGRPAGVGDADRRPARDCAPSSRTRLASLPSARRRTSCAVVHGADARAVIAAIFHPPEPVDQPVRDLLPCRRCR